MRGDQRNWKNLRKLFQKTQIWKTEHTDSAKILAMRSANEANHGKIREKKEYHGRVLIRRGEASFKELRSGVDHHRLHWSEKNEEWEIETLDYELQAILGGETLGFRRQFPRRPREGKEAPWLLYRTLEISKVFRMRPSVSRDLKWSGIRGAGNGARGWYAYGIPQAIYMMQDPEAKSGKRI